MEGSALFRLKPDYSRPPLGEILSRTASLRPPPQAGKWAKTVRIWLRQWPTSPSSLFVENYPWKPTPLYLRALGGPTRAKCGKLTGLPASDAVVFTGSRSTWRKVLGLYRKRSGR